MTLHKKVIRCMLATLYGLPLSILVILIRKFFLIRFQSSMSERIGHFSANFDLYLCEKKFNINRPKIKNYIDIFCLQKKVSNNFLAKKWSEKLIILHYGFVIPIIDCLKFFNQFKYHEIKHNTNSDRDVYNLIDKTKPFIKLSNEENKLGYELLSKIGFNEKTKFVSIVVRDSSYLEQNFKETDYNYHKIRDYKITSFIPAIKFLISQGYKVIIMGSTVNQSINIKSDAIFDYSNSTIKSDFLDIFIISKCEFFIRTSGLGGVAVIFRKPILHLSSHLGYLMTSSKKNLLLLKNFYSVTENKNLSINELFEKNLAFDIEIDYLKKKKIICQESSDDILNATREIVEIIRKKKEYHENEKNLQNKFKKDYLEKIKLLNKSNFHGKFLANMSIEYLKKNFNNYE